MATMPNNEVMPGSISPQERAGREFLAQGRFRKARDEFKLLCKIDRPKFLPLLIEANIGLAREMLGKGMVAEAQQVLDYLKTIATRDQLQVLEIEMKGGSVTPGQGAGVQDILALLAKPSLAEADRQNMADRAVLAFEPVPNPSPETAAAAQELAAVVSALRAISERQFEQALELVRPLGQSSVFGHWKMLIKGLGAFYGGDSERATRFFAGLPASSAPAKASQTYQLLLGSFPLSKDAPLPTEAAIEWAGRMLGERGLGEPLLRAEQAWRKPDPAQMYRKLREGIPRFPGEGLDLIGVLSEFAVNCCFALHFDDRDEYGRMMDDFVERKIASKSPLELQLLARANVLDSVMSMPDSVAAHYWEQFLRAREQLHGHNPALDSLAYGWLGEIFSKPSDSSSGPFFGFGRSRSRMRNEAEARRLLAKAINMDEGNLSASLSLCEVYAQLGQDSDRNKLLDRMTARFPSEKKVLLLAGQACLERKACKRGLDYLNRALTLDRLDPAIPDNLVKGYLLQAREFFQKSRPDDARKAMSQAVAFEVPAPGNLTRSSWCLKTQFGLLETIWGDALVGEKQLNEARQMSPSQAAFLYYAGCAEQEIKPKNSVAAVYFHEFARLKKSEANVAAAVVLTRIWLHWHDLLVERLGYEPTGMLEDYLQAAAKHPFSREDASRLVEFCLAEDEFTGAATAVVEQRLREDARDPLFRLYWLRLHEWTDQPRREKARIELEDILAEAARRKEDQTVRQARQQLDALKNPPPMPRPPIFDDLPPDDEFADEPFPDLAENMPSNPMGSIEEFLDMIANASEKELKRIKQTRPSGMSAADFDMMVEAVRMKTRLPGPKPTPRRDPNQEELF